jgi:hypothetical protein
MANIISSVLVRIFVAERTDVADGAEDDDSDDGPFHSRSDLRKVSAAWFGSDVKLEAIPTPPDTAAPDSRSILVN